MFTAVVITLPAFFEGEAAAICSLFENGLQRLHLRKPGAGERDIAALLRKIPTDYHEKIALHDQFALCGDFGVGGVHLNKRNKRPPSGFKGRLSCSCHSLAEVALRKNEMDYLFLSPIFDSISKEGYSSAFTIEQLERAAASGLIDRKVYALGGVCQDDIPMLRRLSFGGCAVLGDLWKNSVSYDEYVKRLLRLCAAE